MTEANTQDEMCCQEASRCRSQDNVTVTKRRGFPTQRL